MTKKTRTKDWQNTVRRMFGNRWKAAEDIEYGIDCCQNNGRTLWVAVGIIRQLGLESSIDMVVVRCKYFQ